MRKGGKTHLAHAQNSMKWVKETIPLLGPLIAGSYAAAGHTGNMLTDVLAASGDSTLTLQAARAQWNDAYAEFEDAEAHVIAETADALIGPKGYIPLVTEYTTLPLNHTATLLIAPTLGLVVCSLILVWAI
jgi:hypothetical protein